MITDGDTQDDRSSPKFQGGSHPILREFPSSERIVVHWRRMVLETKIQVEANGGFAQWVSRKCPVDKAFWTPVNNDRFAAIPLLQCEVETQLHKGFSDR